MTHVGWRHWAPWVAAIGMALGCTDGTDVRDNPFFGDCVRNLRTGSRVCTADGDASTGIQAELIPISEVSKASVPGSTESLVVKLVSLVEGSEGRVGIWKALIDFTQLGSGYSETIETNESAVAAASWPVPPAPGTYTIRVTVPGSDPALALDFTRIVAGTPTSGRIFSDDFEQDRPWRTVVVTTPGLPPMRHTVERRASLGASGGYRHMVHRLDVETAPDFTTIQVHHIFDQQEYRPQQDGAIRELRWREDRRKISPTGPAQVGTAFVIEQNGVLHTWLPPWTGAVGAGVAGTFDTETWETVERSLTADDFSPRPDFSATGAPMRFGYMRSNTLRFPGEIVHGIDNFRVEVLP